MGLDQITSLTLAFFIGNSTPSTDAGYEYKWCPASNTMGVTACVVTQITKATSWWKLSRSTTVLGDVKGAEGTWNMTSSNCSTIKRLISIINSGDKTCFISRLKNLDLCRYGRVFQHDQREPTVCSLADNTATEAEELPLVDMTIMCKQCDEAFTVTRDQQSVFAKKLMSTPARCKECRRWKRLKVSGMPVETFPKAAQNPTLKTNSRLGP